MFQTTVCVLRSNMLTHVRLIHLNQRRYECSLCQKAAFGTPSKLANHLRKVHRQSDLSEVELLKKKFSQVCVDTRPAHHFKHIFAVFCQVYQLLFVCLIATYLLNSCIYLHLTLFNLGKNFQFQVIQKSKVLNMRCTNVREYCKYCLKY